MIDVNPESSISGSNSNSMISKTPTSSHALAGDLQKDELIDTNRINQTEKTSSCLTIPPGCKCEMKHSEYAAMTSNKFCVFILSLSLDA